MCDLPQLEQKKRGSVKKIPVADAVGMVLGHDITEIRRDEFKGSAFKRGHIVKKEDIGHLQRLGKEYLFVMDIGDDEMHEDVAAHALSAALMGEGVAVQGEPNEGKINIVSERDGLLRINTDALLEFNLLGDVMCATLHNNTMVKKGQIVAATRAIPLIVKRRVIEDAAIITKHSGKIVEVQKLRAPRVGLVITGNEVYYGRIQDTFASIIKKKITDFNGEILGLYYAPDNEQMIADRLKELIEAGADLLITTGGMSVDPDDVTRFAIRSLGATEMTYGSPVLPGAMFLVAYIHTIPILGVPACGMYHKTTVLDLIFPRILAGEKIGRRELAGLGHGGLCLHCSECRYPVCPFGKG